MGTSDGSIIATIITAHMPTNDIAVIVHVWPGIRIQAIDIVQPPGISMPPIAHMDSLHTTVTTTLATNSSEENERKLTPCTRRGVATMRPFRCVLVERCRDYGTYS